MRVEYRAWPEEQRLAPVSELRNVGGKRDHCRLESIDALGEHRVASEGVFEFGARTDDAFDDAFERVVGRHYSEHKLGFGCWRNDVASDAALDHSYVHRRGAQRLVTRKLDPAKIVENVEQFFDGRLAHLRICGMRRAAPRPENC